MSDSHQINPAYTQTEEDMCGITNISDEESRRLHTDWFGNCRTCKFWNGEDNGKHIRWNPSPCTNHRSPLYGTETWTEGNCQEWVSFDPSIEFLSPREIKDSQMGTDIEYVKAAISRVVELLKTQSISLSASNCTVQIMCQNNEDAKDVFTWLHYNQNQMIASFVLDKLSMQRINSDIIVRCDPKESYEKIYDWIESAEITIQSLHK